MIVAAATEVIETILIFFNISLQIGIRVNQQPHETVKAANQTTFRWPLIAPIDSEAEELETQHNRSDARRKI